MIFDFAIFISFLSYACAPSEILIVVFLWRQISKRNQTYTSAYYILISVGYAVSVTYSFAWLLNNLFIEYSKLFDFLANLIDWYFLFFCGFWNFVVGLYRCTALGFPLQHKKIWNGKQVYAVIIVIIFPFFANFQSFLNPYCKIHIYDEECFDEMLDFFFWLLIINTFLSFTLLLIVILSVIKIRLTLNRKSTTAPFERKLILQTILSTFFQILYYLFSTGNEIIYIFDDDTTFALQIIFFIFQHYSSIIVLFVICKHFRRDLLSFYQLKFLVKRGGEISQILFIRRGVVVNNSNNSVIK